MPGPGLQIPPRGKTYRELFHHSPKLLLLKLMAIYKKQSSPEVKCPDDLLGHKSWRYHRELQDKQLIVLYLGFLISKIGRITFPDFFGMLGR